MRRTTIPMPLRVGLILLLGGCSFVFDPDSVPAPAVDGGADAGTREDGGIPPDGGGELPVRIRSFEAEPAEVLPGGYSRLSWVTENATGCTIDSALAAPVPSDSTVVRPASTTTYTLRCEGAGGPQTREVTVTVKPAGSVVILAFTADRETILPGATSQLTWSASNATSCTVSDGAAFQQVVPGGSGAVTVSPASSTEYILSCAGGSGGDATAKQKVEVAAPTQVLITRFEANPNPVSRGGTFTLRWESENATGCALSGESLGPSGSKTLSSPAETRTYTLECTDGSGGSATATTTLYVRASAVTIDRFEVNPPGPVDHGSQVTLSWDSSNATDCRLDWNLESAAPGVDASHPVTVVAPTTFRLLCSRTDPVDAVWEERTVTLNPLKVSIKTPPPIDLAPGASQLFEADVAGAVQRDVTWSVRESDGGSIDAAGVYTAPHVGESPITFHVVARSVVDATVFAEAAVTVHPLPVIHRFDVSPSGELEVGAPTTLSWSVRNASTCRLNPPDQPVNPASGQLQVTPYETTEYLLDCSGPGGTVTSSVSALYQPIAVAVAPVRTSVLVGEPLQFSASVTGAQDKSVAWSLTPSSLGTIDAKGVLEGSGLGSGQLVARSNANPYVSATAAVSVFSPVLTTLSGTVHYSGTNTHPVYVTVLDWPGATGSIPGGGALATGAPFLVHDVMGPSLPPKRVDLNVSERQILSAGGSFHFQAFSPELSGQPIEWKVVEGQPGGSVTEDGLYSAPTECPGGTDQACTFHVMATIKDPATGTPWRAVGTVVVVLSGETPPEAGLGSREVWMQLGESKTLPGEGGTAEAPYVWSILPPALGRIEFNSGLYTAVDAGTDFVLARDMFSGAQSVVKIVISDRVMDVLAFMDVTGSGHYVASVDPAARISVPWALRDKVKLTLSDPLPAAPPPEAACQVFAGNGSAVVLWDSVRDTAGNEVASAYEVLARPGDDKFTPDDVRAEVAAGGQNLAMVRNLATNGTRYWFAVRAKNAKGPSVGVSTCGPIVPLEPTGGYTVTGSVQVGQAPALATLLVFVGAGGGEGPPSKLWYTILPAPLGDQPFAIRGVEAGTQMVGAFLDLDGDGAIEPLEPNTFANGPPQPLEVIGDFVGVKLAFPQTGMQAAVTSEHRREYWGTTVNESHNIEVSVLPSGLAPLRATVVGKVRAGGAYVAQEPSDLSGPTLRDGGSQSAFRRSYPVGQEPPPLDESWVLTVQSVDGRASNLEAAPSGVVAGAATLISPLDTVTPATNSPTFAWNLPSLPPQARLELSVRQAYPASGELWRRDLTPTTTSVVYKDGTGETLPPGTYEWEVRIMDANGNRAVSSSRFQVGPAPLP